MKKTLYILLTFLIIVVILTSCGNKNTNEELIESPVTDFEYEENEDGNITITKYTGNSREVVIPQKIEGKNVTILGWLSFVGNPAIESVYIPDTVTKIEDSVFKDAIYLNKVRLSNKLEVIGDKVFSGCDKLSEITLPVGLKLIGLSAFEKCQSLKHIEIPKSVTELGRNVFVESGLETIKLNEGIKKIPAHFVGSTKIKEIILPDSVEVIDYAAFAGCKELTSFKFGKNIKTLEDSCFAQCNKLTELVFPKSLEYTASLPYEKSLTTLKFEGDAPQVRYSSRESSKKNLIIYYHEGAEGFTSPEWMGHKTKIW